METGNLQLETSMEMLKKTKVNLSIDVSGAKKFNRYLDGGNDIRNLVQPWNKVKQKLPFTS